MALAEHELIAPSDAGLSEGPRLYRWTREQFYRMGERGIFDDRHVELIEGKIIEMPPIGPAHQGINTIIADALRAGFGAGYLVREQGPFSVGAATDPQPDIAVIQGDPRDFLTAHPNTAVLLVEVSDTTLDYDRNVKAGVYAASGVADYWIVNLRGAQIEVHRDPELTAKGSHCYRAVRHYRAGETIRPLGKLDAMFAVADLLP